MQLDRFLEESDRKIADADGPCLTCRPDLLHRRQAVAERDLRIGPMDQ